MSVTVDRLYQAPTTGPGFGLGIGNCYWKRRQKETREEGRGTILFIPLCNAVTNRKTKNNLPLSSTLSPAVSFSRPPLFPPNILPFPILLLPLLSRHLCVCVFMCVCEYAHVHKGLPTAFQTSQHSTTFQHTNTPTHHLQLSVLGTQHAGRHQANILP